MKEGINVDRLAQLIAAKGVTARALSLAITGNRNPYVVRDILAGRTKHGRSSTVAAIADYFGVPIEELVNQASQHHLQKQRVQVEPHFLAVRYVVQAGAWFELETEEPPEQVSLAVLPLPKYAAWPQWLEKVVGTSANRRIPDGHYIHVVDALEMGYAPRNGDWVVVLRMRDQGAVHERSVKQVEVQADGSIHLCPRSDDPRWQTPLDYTAGARNGEEGIEVRIVGLVVAAIDPNF